MDIKETANTDILITRKKTKLPFAIGGIVIAVIFVILGIVVYSNPQRKYERQIALGERYLDELNYEQAIAAYLAAIEIDPKNPEAYKALADIYIDMGDLASAEAILKKGIEETESSRLEHLLAEIEELKKDTTIANEMVMTTNTEKETASSSSMIENFQPEIDDEEMCADEEIEIKRDGSIRREGDYIVFGYYEQDWNDENGLEPIEWEVLDRKDDKMFLVSRYILHCRAYDESDPWGMPTWESCSLRKWLNDEFLNEAFLPIEQSKILLTEVSNPDNLLFGSDGGNDTEDRLFLLGVDDLRKYYKFDSWDDENQNGYCHDLIVDETTYAMTTGVGSNSHTISQYDYDNGLASKGYDSSVIGMRGTIWWLRTIEANTVYQNGNAGWYCGSFVKDATLGVRPAMWIDISDGIINDTMNDPSQMNDEADEWKKAYYDFVSNDDSIQDLVSEPPGSDAGIEGFALAYVDGDDIPELFVLAYGNRPWTDVHTYYDGTLYENIAWGNELDYIEHSGYMISHGILGASGESREILFLEKGSVKTDISGELTYFDDGTNGYKLNNEMVSESDYNDIFRSYLDRVTPLKTMSYEELMNYLNGSY